jgi:hypothetical protein
MIHEDNDTRTLAELFQNIGWRYLLCGKKGKAHE